MQDEIYELMAQAEELQKHAATLQKDAQSAFSRIPRQIDRIAEETRSTARLWAIATACALAAAVLLIGGLILGWTLSAGGKLAALRAEIAASERRISELDDQEARLKIWGGRLIENDAGRFIDFPENFELRIAEIDGRPTVRIRPGKREARNGGSQPDR